MDSSTSAALYARVSSQQQAEQMTIQSQVAALRQRIEQDGLTVAEELCFLDEGYSGSTLLRPSLERLRRLGSLRGRGSAVRPLARSFGSQVRVPDGAAGGVLAQGVQVIFLDHDPQHQSAEGNLLLQMQGMIAEYERAKILERTRRGAGSQRGRARSACWPTHPTAIATCPSIRQTARHATTSCSKKRDGCESCLCGSVWKACRWDEPPTDWRTRAC